MSDARNQQKKCFLCDKNLGKFSLKVNQDDMKLEKVVIPEGMKNNEIVCTKCFSTLQKLQEEKKIESNDSCNDNHSKFCGKCGVSLLPTNDFCTECGFPAKTTPHKLETMKPVDVQTIEKIRKNKKAIAKAAIGVAIPLIIVGFLIYHMVGFTVPDLIQNNERVEEANQRLDDAALNLINACWSQPSEFCDQEMSNLKNDCKTSQFANVKACTNGKFRDYIISRGL